MEIKDIVISIVVPLVVAVMSYFGSRRGTKVAREEFENRKEATPPELLRLEKWSTILKDSSDYPENIKHELDIDTIQFTYNDILKRATLENRIMDIAVWDLEVEDKLLKTKTNRGRGVYPFQEWKSQRLFRPIFIIPLVFEILGLMILIIPFLKIFKFNFLENYEFDFSNPWSYIHVIAVCFVLRTIARVFYNKKSKGVLKELKKEALIKNISYRNCYYALRDVFLLEDFELIEDGDESAERKKFEKSKEYEDWKDRVKKEYPEWTSWNYGLSIIWDNNPYKNNTNGLEPNHLPSSLFKAEDLKRQEP